MICDLAIEALFKLNRLVKGRCCQSDIGIQYLTSEQLAALVTAGWLEQLPGPRRSDRASERPTGSLYGITDAGREHVQHLVSTSRLRAMTPA